MLVLCFIFVFVFIVGLFMLNFMVFLLFLVKDVFYGGVGLVGVFLVM